MILIFIGNEILELNDLFNHKIIEQVATYWEELGLELGLMDHFLDEILQNSKHHPNKTERCCCDMFLTWLKIGMQPTWDKLDDAINRLTSKKENILLFSL